MEDHKKNKRSATRVTSVSGMEDRTEKNYSFAETQTTSSKNGKDYDMQEKAIASEKLVAAKWPGGQVLPLDRHHHAGRLGRDCFPAHRINSTPKGAPVVTGGGAA